MALPGALPSGQRATKQRGAVGYLTIDDVEIGESYSEEVRFDQERLARFMDLTRDTAAIHTKQDFSERKGFEDLVVHGFLLSVQFSRILGMELPGEQTVIGSVNLNFHEPVYVGDTARFTATVRRKLPPLGAVQLDLRIEKAGGGLCVAGTAVCAFKKDQDETNGTS